MSRGLARPLGSQRLLDMDWLRAPARGGRLHRARRRGLILTSDPVGWFRSDDSWHRWMLGTTVRSAPAESKRGWTGGSIVPVSRSRGCADFRAERPDRASL